MIFYSFTNLIKLSSALLIRKIQERIQDIHSELENRSCRSSLKKINNEVMKAVGKNNQT